MQAINSNTAQPRRSAVLGAVLLGAVLTASTAQAQSGNFPERPITMVVTSAPGGGVDLLVRAIAVDLAKRFNQPIIVDNKAGASGIIAAQYVSRAQPDGYTWLAGTEQHIITNRFTHANLGYDPQKDLVGISLLAQAEQLIVASTGFAANTVGELITMAKKEPGKYAYGSWGEGSHPHMIYTTMGKAAGIDLIHVPYKGVAPVMQALAANNVQVSVMSGGTAGPLIKAGKIKVLAAAGRERSPEFPGTQTTREAGFPNLRSEIWFALMAPAATPPALLKKSATEVQAVMRNGDFAQRNVTSKGWRLVASDPAGMKEAVDELAPMIGELVDKAGLKGKAGT